MNNRTASSERIAECEIASLNERVRYLEQNISAIHAENERLKRERDEAIVERDAAVVEIKRILMKAEGKSIAKRLKERVFAAPPKGGIE